MEVYKVEFKTNLGARTCYFIETTRGYRRLMFDLDNFFQIRDEDIIKKEKVELSRITGKLIIEK